MPTQNLVYDKAALYSVIANFYKGIQWGIHSCIDRVRHWIGDSGKSKSSLKFNLVLDSVLTDAESESEVKSLFCNCMFSRFVGIIFTIHLRCFHPFITGLVVIVQLYLRILTRISSLIILVPIRVQPRVRDVVITQLFCSGYLLPKIRICNWPVQITFLFSYFAIPAG